MPSGERQRASGGARAHLHDNHRVLQDAQTNQASEVRVEVLGHHGARGTVVRRLACAKASSIGILRTSERARARSHTCGRGWRWMSYSVNPSISSTSFHLLAGFMVATDCRSRQVARPGRLPSDWLGIVSGAHHWPCLLQPMVPACSLPQAKAISEGTGAVQAAGMADNTLFLEAAHYIREHGVDSASDVDKVTLEALLRRAHGHAAPETATDPGASAPWIRRSCAAHGCMMALDGSGWLQLTGGSGAVRARESVRCAACNATATSQASVEDGVQPVVGGGPRSLCALGA